ncbi:MAG TPA: glutamate synthase-related protein [Candidatus Bathyarchaeia archaeon]
MSYERFHIGTEPAPNVYRVPNRFDVKARKLGLAAMLIHEAFEYRFNRDVVLSRPCIYGVFGGRLGGFKPIKEKCVGCMRCVQEYPHIMTVRPSDEYKRLGDSHWTPDAVFTILYESSTGKIPVKGMGYKGSFGGEGFDGIWTDMSEIVRPTRDGVYGREYISTVVDIGRKPFSLDFSRNGADGVVRTVEAPIPIIFDELPNTSTSEEVLAATASAAAKLDTFYVSKPRKDADRRNLIPLVGEEDITGNPLLKRSKIVEYDSDMSDLHGKLKAIDPSLVVSARVALREGCEERAYRLVRDGIDVLHVYADLHGTDYSTKPRHLSTALKALHGHLVKEGIRDQVTIIASGGITLAEHVPKAIICGADLVGIDTTLLVALHAEFKGEAKDRNSCQLVPRKIDPEWGSQRIVNLMASWRDQLIEILSAMGMRDVRRLRGDVGRSMVDSELREQAFEGIAWAA